MTEPIATGRHAAPADLQRWSEELARNPASLAFLPLARAYRRQNRLDLALKLCLAGLEHHPTHVEGHALLALLYLESGDRAKAADEWSTVLRLKPGNFEALRGMGFRYLEQGDAAKARQHLERAALIRPDDAVVQEALRLLRQRHDEPAGRAAPEAEPAPAPAAQTPPAAPAQQAPPAPAPAAPAQQTPPPPAAPAQQAPPAPAPAPAAPAQQAPPARAPAPARAAPAGPLDPTQLFAPILGERPALGVLLLDRRGYLLAGGLRDDVGRADGVGALLANAVDEAVRTATHLELGAWRMLRIEANTAIVHVVPASEDALIAIAARRDTPLGWLMRSAASAANIAAGYLEGAHGR